MDRSDENLRRAGRFRGALLVVCVLSSILTASSCGTLEKPVPSPYFADAAPPAKRELRWSNGKLPKSFDPALAEAPPETDVVRAIYQGLTTIDPKTLNAAPAAAEKWSSSDNRTWIFQLRKDAKWTNGKNVTAQDFVRSWNRLAAMGDKAAHSDLLKNFDRLKAEKPKETTSPAPIEKPLKESNENVTANSPPISLETNTQASGQQNTAAREIKPGSLSESLAIKAESDLVLSVTLEMPDPDFPKLVANPIFSPIFGDGSEFQATSPETAIISNGPFRVAAFGKSALVLAKSDSFFDSGSVQLDAVRFVPVETTEEAVEAYRSGSVDVVTNTEFEPAALKLLAPFEDFRKMTHGALNLYEFNQSREPFSDRRVREALAIAIERERLTEGELEGSTRPAYRFLPFGGKQVPQLTQDVSRAKSLLESAGFPEGAGFPTVRLVINRNDIQQRIARAVARMWKQNLSIDTEIIVKETADIQAVRTSGDFDLIRKGVVFSTSDPQSNLAAIFDADHTREVEISKFGGHESKENSPANTSQKPVEDPAGRNLHEVGEQRSVADLVPTEAQALLDFPAIPLYFPTSYSLIKPYVHGYEPNGLDLFPLDDISIDNDWQPKRANGES
jgi:oligopeptide transport system substrate-binding protein